MENDIIIFRNGELELEVTISEDRETVWLSAALSQLQTRRYVMTAIITPTILAIVILIVRPKVITRIPKLRTTGSVSPKVSPKFSQVSHGISEARFPIKPPSTIPVSKNSSRIQKFFALLISVCSLPCIPVSNDFHLWGITPILLIVA